MGATTAARLLVLDVDRLAHRVAPVHPEPVEVADHRRALRPNLRRMPDRLGDVPVRARPYAPRRAGLVAVHVRRARAQDHRLLPREPDRVGVAVEVVGVVDDRVRHRHKNRAPRRQAHVRGPGERDARCWLRFVQFPAFEDRVWIALRPTIAHLPLQSKRRIHFIVSSRLSRSSGTSMIPYSYPSNRIGLMIRATSL